MEITALGHAGLRIATNDGDVLMDPWLSRRGAFQSSWFQFPENANVSLGDPTAVVISHEHLDHLDADTLGSIRWDASPADVVVPDYPSDLLWRKLRRASVPAGRVREVAASQWHRLGATTRVLFLPEESPMNHDAAILLRDGDGTTVLNMNDARLSPDQLRAARELAGGHIDVLALQGAGASWYPLCYEYPRDRIERLSRRKRMAKLRYVSSAVGIVEPGIVLPVAGPPCFLDPELMDFNEHIFEDHGIFPHQGAVADHLSRLGFDAAFTLLPGDTLTAPGGVVVPCSRWGDFDLKHDGRAHIEDYARRRTAEIEAIHAQCPAPEDVGPQFESYLSRLLGLNEYFLSRIDMTVGFRILGGGGGEWSVDLRPGGAVREGIDPGCGYVYAFESRWLVPILRGDVPWEDFFLSLRFRSRRNPDVYSDHLLGLLKFADQDALRAVEDFESSALDSGETIRVESNGQQYEIQRYCPHAGHDLRDGSIVLDDGRLLCLGHHYEFDIATGLCLTGKSGALRTQRIERPHRVG